jgi:hypothetical protein
MMGVGIGGASSSTTKVRVGVRVRPLNSREGNPVLSCHCHNAVEISGAQYTYDHVFDSQVSQEELYREIRPMLSSFLEGFNATVRIVLYLFIASSLARRFGL